MVARDHKTPSSTYPASSANILVKGKNDLSHVLMKKIKTLNFPLSSLKRNSTIIVVFVDVMNFAVITVNIVIKH